MTKFVTSVRISCSDSSCDFIRMSFATNFFPGDIEGMVYVLCCSIGVIIIAEAIGNL